MCASNLTDGGWLQFGTPNGFNAAEVVAEGGVVVVVVVGGGFGDGEALDEAAVGEGFDVGVLGCLHGGILLYT